MPASWPFLLMVLGILLELLGVGWILSGAARGDVPGALPVGLPIMLVSSLLVAAGMVARKRTR